MDAQNGKKVALVTGGTGGIGSAISQKLAKEGFLTVAGYSSGGNHAKAKAWREEQRKQGYDVEISYGEITKPHSCEECVEEVKKRFGKISVLVNNAGITRDSVFKKMSVDQWEDVIQVNLNGVFYMSKLVVGDMLEEGWGRIVNISSVNAQRGQFGQTNYSAAKAGMHGFTKALAREVASKGVTVNTISPGYIATKMIMDIREDIRDEILKDIPVRRFGKPDEIADLVYYLAGNQASYITGANIAINGGMHME